jgi:hypothetical protein
MRKILLMLIIGILMTTEYGVAVRTPSTENNSSNVPVEHYDFLIITAQDLVDSITSSTFIDWKTQIGFTLKIVTVSDTEIASQPGRDLAEQIRNFLRAYYTSWGIEYVLLVGDSETIPMRYCYPDPENHKNFAGHPLLYELLTGGELPTDFYYSDLSFSDSESWDLDGDGYYGEIDEDLPDFDSEVIVGRIPTSNTERIIYTLDKTVQFEMDTGDWKNHALLAGAFSYFDNETNRRGDEYLLHDGACLMNEIEDHLMTEGWTISHYSEQHGRMTSAYSWNALDADAFVSDWRDNTYGIVNWASHSYPFVATRKIWRWDDGDDIPESFEMTYPKFLSIRSKLDDDYPSIVFAKGCLVGYPEKNMFGNLGVDLLTKPGFGAAVNVLSCTRSPILQRYYPELPGGSDSMCYEFNRFLLQESNGTETTGEAFYHMKQYYQHNISFFILWGHIPEYARNAKIADYKNMFNFNLYGDPSLMRCGVVI